MRLVLVPILLLLATAGSLPAAHGSTMVMRAYSQTYQVAAEGVITVVCPDLSKDPTSQWGLMDDSCVPGMDGPGVPATQQMWFGGVGIDLPADAMLDSVVVTDATGTATPAAVCIDHNMNNLCGPSDASQDPSMPETAIFFCGHAENLDATFGMPMMMPGMMTQHVDVWVRTAGNLGYFMGDDAPLCAGGVAGAGPLGVGTRGVVTIYAMVPE